MYPNCRVKIVRWGEIAPTQLMHAFGAGLMVACLARRGDARGDQGRARLVGCSGYASGLVLAFVANEYVKRGQVRPWLGRVCVFVMLIVYVCACMGINVHRYAHARTRAHARTHGCRGSARERERERNTHTNVYTHACICYSGTDQKEMKSVEL